MSEKISLNKIEYYVEVSYSDENNSIFEVVDDHVVEKPNSNDEIGLRGFGS